MRKFTVISMRNEEAMSVETKEGTIDEGDNGGARIEGEYFMKAGVNLWQNIYEYENGYRVYKIVTLIEEGK